MTADKVTADKVSDRQGWLFDRGGLFPRRPRPFVGRHRNKREIARQLYLSRLQDGAATDNIACW